ncbi:hypothetical protein EGW08_006483, partial [Elysia chlorotica]
MSQKILHKTLERENDVLDEEAKMILTDMFNEQRKLRAILSLLTNHSRCIRCQPNTRLERELLELKTRAGYHDGQDARQARAGYHDGQDARYVRQASVDVPPALKARAGYHDGQDARQVRPALKTRAGY